MEQRIIIVGSGGHCRVVIDAIKSFGSKYHIIGIADINYSDTSDKTPIFDIPIIGNTDSIFYRSDVFKIAIAIGDNETRKRYYNEFAEKYKDFHDKDILMPIVHKSAIVSNYAYIGDGTFINAGAIINAGCIIGTNAIINTGAIIDHECRIGDNSHICPGVKIGGRVKIGENCFIGIGSSIIHNINIGDNVTTGGGSVVIRDIPDNTKVVGVPAKPIK